MNILQKILVLVVISNLVLASAQTGSQCERSCGNMAIPYPFGLVEECSYSPQFHVTCNRSFDQPTPFFTDNTAITDISLSTGEIEIMMFVAHDCYNISGREKVNRPYLTLSTFQISTKNRFVAIGCDTHAYISGSRRNESDGTRCISTCESNLGVRNGSCPGVGCCKVEIPEGMNSFDLILSSYDNHTNILDFNPCSHAFVVNNEKYNFSSNNLLDFKTREMMPMLLDWYVGNSSCDVESKDPDNFQCKGKSECAQNYTGPGYRCSCLEGYAGNPYIEDGCKDIDECGQGHPELNKCLDPHLCDNKEGGYECKCKKGYSGDGKKEGGSGCTLDQSLVTTIIICTLAAIIFLLMVVSWVYLGVKKHKGMKLREKFFRQNGGIMLQQRNNRDRGSHDQAKVFTVEELKRATNNYDDSRIIGKGGYGTVYKGVLSDDRVVAIKKSKLPDQTDTQIEQFINEVIILSQINHRNVVKLIGCCLETEVPLLVYEFIPNGTLSDHIHDESKSLAVTWDIRLRIATETAGALSYLHSQASVPIIHRDVKPMNILLDDGYVAKVADFGASRLIPMDQAELATIVQGTLGYLDPEYWHTSQLTDKSDVYSFGVVLVELLTGKKVLNFDRPEKERNIAVYFISSLKEGGLLQVIDERLQLNEVPNEVIQVSRLAERCLRQNRDERPTMKEVAIELEGIMASVTHKHPWVKSTTNEEETEYLLREPMGGHGYTDGANTSSNTFDSISKHITLPIASGR